MPRAMRYQPKGLKSCLRTKPMRKRMQARETTKATAQPTSRTASSMGEKTLPLRKYLTRRRPEAPTMTGMAR